MTKTWLILAAAAGVATVAVVSTPACALDDFFAGAEVAALLDPDEEQAPATSTSAETSSTERVTRVSIETASHAQPDRDSPNLIRPDLIRSCWSAPAGTIEYSISTT